MDYSIIYTIIFSIFMSISACAGLVCIGTKTHYPLLKCFFMLLIPKTIFSLIRYYFENFESNLILLILLILSMMIFDVIMLFVIFDCPMIQKILYIAMMDVIFIPILLVKQAFESKYITEQNTLEFENIYQIIIPLICYAILFALLIITVHFFSKLINKINFSKPIFDIFGMLALFGYLTMELLAVVMFWQNLASRENQFFQYAICTLIYCCTLLIMYFVSNHFTKKRLKREIDILNTEKEREFKYYNLMKTHNEEIQKINHDLNGHFNVLSALVKDNQYEKIGTYIESLYNDYNQIKRVVYTSNLMADAVITVAASKCNKNSIDFECQGVLTDNCFIDDISITCIFSNILDNAIEACEKLNQNKFIKLSIFKKSDCIVITCRNSKAQPTKNQTIPFLTTKTENGHGYGIKIIKEIVTDYDGVVTLEDKGTEFEISLLIPEKPVTKKN